MTHEVTDKDFKQEVLDFDGVTLVDFWAVWCGPCRVQGPIVQELAEQFKDNPKVKVLKLNVDENQETAMAYQILSIPTLKIFKGGQVAADFVGVQSKEALEQKIKQQL